MQKSLVAKLRGWNDPDVKFVVIQDQDSNDCKELKAKLLDLCKNSQKEVLIRIACHELEAWYFGDINALSTAYGVDLSNVKRKSKYRIPDAIVNPKAELRRLLPEHQQMAGARKLAPIIKIENNSSVSFQMFIKGVKKLDKIGLVLKQKFSLHYDFGDDWMFAITVQKITETSEKAAQTVIKEKGSIEQYPEWDEEEEDYE